MQVPDPRKRRLICAAAERLFATRPYHKVRLGDVAAAAHVGKGTLYVYFRSKEDLYLGLVYDRFVSLVQRLGELVSNKATASQNLQRIITELVDFAYRHPHMAEIMRTSLLARSSRQWLTKRRQLTSLIEGVLRQGVASGELSDAHPELSAIYIPGMVRGALLFGPAGLGKQALARHIHAVITRGLLRRTGK
jgi:AcrR family transcriptional regulator